MDILTLLIIVVIGCAIMYFFSYLVSDRLWHFAKQSSLSLGVYYVRGEYGPSVSSEFAV